VLALQRLRKLSTDCGQWDEDWVTEGQAEVVLDDLSIVSFGLSTEVWNALAAEAHVVVCTTAHS
jgi:thioester reductase-like protein